MDAGYLREGEFMDMLDKDEWFIRSASIISRFCVYPDDKSGTYDQTNDIKEITNLHSHEQKHVSITNHHDFYSYVVNNFTKERIKEKRDVFDTIIRIEESYNHIRKKSEIEEIHYTISCDYFKPRKYETIGSDEKDHVYETLYVYLSKDMNFYPSE